MSLETNTNEPQKQNADQDLINKAESSSWSRRMFLNTLGLGAAAIGLQQVGCSPKTVTASADGNKAIAGFDETGKESADIHAGWQPVSDRKVKVGLVGYGLSKFSAAFRFQDHPNVEVVAVSDLFPDRCAELAKAARCNKTYPSLEEMVKDKSIEAIYVATDAPSHAKHAMLVLNHGKHVAVAVPAVFASTEEAQDLYDTVKRTGKKYMMFETSSFREDNWAIRQIYNAGGFGKMVYTEGEYLHYGSTFLASYNGWREGSPPMFYLTHATAYHIGVTDETFVDVSCYGKPSHLPYLVGGKNRYNNPYGTQTAIFRTSGGAISRMLYSKDTPGLGAEEGRVRGQLGSYNRAKGYEGDMKDKLPDLKRPPLPPGVTPGGHGGSHGHLTEEFIRAILEDRHPLIDIATSLNMSVPGIIAHQSCLKGGESLKIPQFKMWG